MARPRWPQPISPHSPKMKLNCPLNAAERNVNGLARCHAPRQIWHRCTPVTARILVDTDKILELPHGSPRFNPAWRRTEPNVPLGMSSPGWPLTVTRPGLVGCLNWRWLPFVTTRTHPSCTRRRITSRTFTPCTLSDEPEAAPDCRSLRPVFRRTSHSRRDPRKNRGHPPEVGSRLPESRGRLSPRAPSRGGCPLWIEAYDRDEPLPSLQGQPLPALLEVSESIRRILEERAFNTRVEEWIEGLKGGTRIRRYVF